MRISDWSSDVCSSDLEVLCTGLVMQGFGSLEQHLEGELTSPDMLDAHADQLLVVRNHHRLDRFQDLLGALLGQRNVPFDPLGLEPLQQCPVSRLRRGRLEERSEEHTSELQSLMRISYAVFCLQNKHINFSTSLGSSVSL